MRHLHCGSTWRKSEETAPNYCIYCWVAYYKTILWDKETNTNKVTKRYTKYQKVLGHQVLSWSFLYSMSGMMGMTTMNYSIARWFREPHELRWSAIWLAGRTWILEVHQAQYLENGAVPRLSMVDPEHPNVLRTWEMSCSTTHTHTHSIIFYPYQSSCIDRLDRQTKKQAQWMPWTFIHLTRQMRVSIRVHTQWQDQMWTGVRTLKRTG